MNSTTQRVLGRLYRLFREVKHSLLMSAFGYSSVCRHHPSCSQYARQQIEEHGTIWGISKGIVRILRCW